MTAIRTDRFYGITDPFALMVPTEEIAKTRLPAAWEVDGYRFSAGQSGRSDRIVVVAGPTPTRRVETGDAVYTLHYSYRSGIISFEDRRYALGKLWVEEYRPCWGEELHLTQLTGAGGQASGAPKAK